MKLLLCIALALAGATVPAIPRDLGQWKNSDPAIGLWFRSLLQPDTIGMGGGTSCCGEADAYWADEAHVRDGKVFAVITDDRDDEPLKRPHEEIGTEYEVPQSKIVGMEQRLGNPTGHIVIFLGTITWPRGKYHRDVLCYVENGGV
jgi:hypothetical protein